MLTTSGVLLLFIIVALKPDFRFRTAPMNVFHVALLDVVDGKTLHWEILG